MSSIRGNQLLLETIEREGVRYLFGNPGATEVPWLDLLPEHPALQYVLALHEDVALAMADGYAQASGQVGVATVHATPGTAHALGNLFNASVTGTPLVVIVGQVHGGLLIGEPFLAADILQMAQQYVKWGWQVSRIDELSLALHRAFKVASDPPTGPALVVVPVDLLDQTTDAPPAPFDRQKLARATTPDARAIGRAAQVLAAAKWPALLCGPGVVRSGAIPAAVELAERLGMRTYGDVRYPASFPTSHATYVGLLSDDALAQCDVLLVVGQKMFLEARFRQHPRVPPHVRVIHIDVDPREIGKNYPVEVGIISDPRLGLESLNEALASQLSAADIARGQSRAETLAEQKERVREQNQREIREHWDDVPISAQRLAAELAGVLPAEANLVMEAITTQNCIRRLMEFPDPGATFAMVGGSLGWGLPAALGVKLARPERPVVAVVGDGSYMYYPQTLWTAARYKLPVLTVICNNRGYLTDKVPLLRRGGPASMKGDCDPVEIVRPEIDLVKCAQAIGSYAERVERPNDLGPALRRALATSGPAVIDVAIDPAHYEL